jgi:hypothetical protein
MMICNRRTNLVILFFPFIAISFSSFALHFALRGWGIRVLHFEPIGRAAGA